MGDAGRAGGRAARPRSLFALGGLVTVQPGCCAGLENWRESWWLLDGDRTPPFAHDPTPVAEEVGAVFRLWPDEAERYAYVDIPRAELPGLLDGVRRDLEAFAAPLRARAVAHGLAGCR